MPFVFDAGDFEPVQPSPLEDFLTSMFQETAAGIKQGYADKREDARFQKQLDLQRKHWESTQQMQREQLDWEKAQSEGALKREQQGREAGAKVLSSQMTDRRPWQQGKPVNPGTLAEYAVKQQQRASQMEGVLRGLPVRDQEVLLRYYRDQEDRHLQRAKRSDLGRTMRGHAMELGARASVAAPQGPSASPVVEQYRAQANQIRASVSQQLAAIADAVESGQMDPDQALRMSTDIEQQLQQQEVSLQAAERHENSRMRASAGYATRISGIQARLDEELGRNPPNEDYIRHLQEQLDQLAPILEGYNADPSMTTAQLANQWESSIRDYRPPSARGQTSEFEQLLKHYDAQEDMIMKRVSAGLMDQDAAAAQIQELDAMRQVLMEMGQEAASGQPLPEVPAGGAHLPPAQEPVMPEEVMIRKLALGKNQEVLAALASAGVPAQQAEELIQNLRPKVEELAAKLSKGSGFGAEATAPVVEAKADTTALEEKFRKEVGAEPPMTREDLLLALDEFYRVENEPQKTRRRLVSAKGGAFIDEPTPESAQRRSWSKKAGSLLRAIWNKRGYGTFSPEAMTEEIVALRQKRGMF